MTFWYVNRAAGLVAWALLSASILCGLLLSSKALAPTSLGKVARPNWLTDLHRGLSGLAVIFVGIHVAGAVGDNYLHFGWAEVLVPFTSAWRPVAVAWGVVSAYLLVAIEATSLLRKHLSKRAWRAVHFSAFPLFLTATVHAVTAGTEMGTTIGIAVASLVTAGVAGLTTLRIMEAKRPHPSASDRVRRAPTAAPGPGASAPASPPAPTPAHNPLVAPRTVGAVGGYPPVAGPEVAVHRPPAERRVPHEVGSRF